MILHPPAPHALLHLSYAVHVCVGLDTTTDGY